MSEQPVVTTIAVAQDAALFVPYAETPKPSLFTILVVDLLALALALCGSQVSDDEGISGGIVMMLMIGALAGHVVVAHYRSSRATSSKT